MACSKLYFAMLILLNAVETNGWLFWKTEENKKPEWDELKVTFLKFNDLPISSGEAMKEGWTSNTAACQNNGYFKGNRYILNNDPAVMLLFDSHGKIAGIQNGVPKSRAIGAFFQKDYWVEDGDLLVITAYFVDPSVICNGEREKSQYLGDSLFIQIGKTPGSLMTVPLKEEDTKVTKWVKGKCVYGMGQHYWYNISTDMSCDDFFPAFLLYNKGKLNAFGWVSIGNFNSSRYEHPPTSFLDYFLQPESLPICVKKLPSLSTIHIYLQYWPYFNFC